MDETRGRARSLRRAQTDAERALWRELRGRHFEGYKFRRQRPIGPYFVDFVCMERGLVVELDGAHHAGQPEYDAIRDDFLRAAGFRVLRFTNRQALTEPDGVASAILRELEAAPVRWRRGSGSLFRYGMGSGGGGRGPSPQPSPRVGRGSRKF